MIFVCTQKCDAFNLWLMMKLKYQKSNNFILYVGKNNNPNKLNCLGIKETKY